MMRNFLIISAFTTIIFSACAQQKKATTNTSTNTSSTTTATTTTTNNNQSTEATTYAMMERTPCFGRCPHYQLEFFADGTVRYMGINSTDYEGVYEKKMDPKKIKDVLKMFDTYRVDTCKDAYEPLITDVPGLNFKMKKGEEMKSIQYANFGPSFLDEIARKMDQTAAPDKTWKRIGDIERN